MTYRFAPNIERQIRSCAVPPQIAATLARLPRPLRVCAAIPAGDIALGIAGRQWLKLALRGDGVTLGEITTAAKLRLEVSLEERACVFGDQDLTRDLRHGLPPEILDLLGAGDIAALLSQLAHSTSSLVTLRKVTSRMLATSDRKVAYRLLLRGVTAGFGLGFHRAAVFASDGDRLRGTWAEGHVDEAEAHRVWESLELEDVDVERTLDDAIVDRPSLLADAVSKLAFDAADPWVERVLGAPGAMLLAADDRGPLGALDVRTPFVVAPLRARGAPFGILFADDRWDEASSISDERLRHVQLFADQAALVIDNLRLFERTLDLSRTDPLTGLANRRELDARLAVLADRARRSELSIGLLVVDVDHFKKTNDTEGHEAGDDILRRVAQVLERNVRAQDTVARFGGDEFVVLVPDTDRAALARIVRSIGVETAEAQLHVSVGGALFPSHADAPERLFASADEALYRAKAAGRRVGFIGEEKVEFARNLD